MQVPGPGDPASLITYNYDRLDRLSGASGASGVRTYTYDPAGNRLTRTEGTTTTSAHDRADRLTAVGSTAVTVDAAGNRLTRTEGDERVAAVIGDASENYIRNLGGMP